jgi:hypothetical protein
MENFVTSSYLKPALITLWTAVVAIVGLTLGTAGAGWFPLLAVAVVPAAVLLWFWVPPPTTTSERIRRAQR